MHPLTAKALVSSGFRGCYRILRMKSVVLSLLSADRALEIALRCAGTAREHALQIETELDREQGALIYEVEFKLNGIEHDFEIDAVTGEILKHETEPDD